MLCLWPISETHIRNVPSKHFRLLHALTISIALLAQRGFQSSSSHFEKFSNLEGESFTSDQGPQPRPHYSRANCSRQMADYKILSTGNIEYYLEVKKIEEPVTKLPNDKVHECGIVTREEDRFLLYRTSSILVKANVKIQKSIANHDWLIGFVQATDRMESENVFGNAGKARWELHPLKSGKQKMVNSSSGNSSTPYIMGNNVLRIRRGEMRRCTTSIQFEEYHEPTINWWILSRSNKLTKVVRRNRIVLWLVAFRTRKSLVDMESAEIDWRSEKISVLATIKWDMQVVIDIDPDQTLGNRVRECRRSLIGPKVYEGERKRLPASALSSLSASDCQSLIWYPKRGQMRLDGKKAKVQVLVPPRKSIADTWEQWISEMTGSVTKVDMNNRPEFVKVEHCIDDPFISTYRSRASRSELPLVKEEHQGEHQAGGANAAGHDGEEEEPSTVGHLESGDACEAAQLQKLRSQLGRGKLNRHS